MSVEYARIVRSYHLLVRQFRIATLFIESMAAASIHRPLFHAAPRGAEITEAAADSRSGVTPQGPRALEKLQTSALVNAEPSSHGLAINGLHWHAHES